MTSLAIEVTERARVTTALTGGCAGEPSAVSWASSDERVATVSGDGMVTGVGIGTSTLTATAFDGVTRATVPVTVRARRLPCTTARTLEVPGTLDGTVSASVCRDLFGLGALDLVRYAAGGGPLSMLVTLQPRFAAVFVPLRAQGAAVSLGPVADGATARAIVVIPAGRAADSTTGAAVGSVSAVEGGGYRLVTTLAPDPARLCVPTVTVRAVAFETALSSADEGDIVACSVRDVHLVPPIAAGARLRVVATTAAMHITIQLVETTGARRVLATASNGTGTRGGPATITWTAPSPTPVLVRLVRNNQRSARVQVTID